MLINIAEERQESIPALIYSAGMASFDRENDPIGGYRTGETSSKSSYSHSKKGWFFWLPFLSNSGKGYHTVQGEEEEEESALRSGSEDPNLSVNELSDLSNTRRTMAQRERRTEEESDDEDDELNAIKLGLGDFIFYSVLVGRASRTNAVTLSLCIVAILTVSYMKYVL